MIPTTGTAVELNKRLSRYKISAAVAADRRRARRNYIPVTHPLISDRRMRGGRKMIPTLSLALSLIRLRRNELYQGGGRQIICVLGCLRARSAHSNDASTYAIVGQ